MPPYPVRWIPGERIERSYQDHANELTKVKYDPLTSAPILASPIWMRRVEL